MTVKLPWQIWMNRLYESTRDLYDNHKILFLFYGTWYISMIIDQMYSDASGRCRRTILLPHCSVSQSASYQTQFIAMSLLQGYSIPFRLHVGWGQDCVLLLSFSCMRCRILLISQHDLKQIQILQRIFEWLNLLQNNEWRVGRDTVESSYTWLYQFIKSTYLLQHIKARKKPMNCIPSQN